jgi:hypothetical protein
MPALQVAQQATELTVVDVRTVVEQSLEQRGQEACPFLWRQRPGHELDVVDLFIRESERHGGIHWRAGAAQIECARYWLACDSELGPLDPWRAFCLGQRRGPLIWLQARPYTAARDRNPEVLHLAAKSAARAALTSFPGDMLVLVMCWQNLRTCSHLEQAWVEHQESLRPSL